MSKSTGPNTKNIHGKPYQCVECGAPRLKGTQLCESCKKAYKEANARRHEVREQ